VYISRSEITEMLLDALPILVCDMDSGEILWASKPAESIFGFSIHGAMVGTNVDQLVPTEKQGSHSEHRREFAQKPHTRSMGAGYFLEGQSQDGTRFPVEIGLIPGIIDKRRLVFAIVLNMSDRKKT